MTTIITAIADLVDTSADRYARAFGPLMPTRAPVEKSVRTISVFRSH